MSGDSGGDHKRWQWSSVFSTTPRKGGKPVYVMHCYVSSNTCGFRF